MKNYFYFAFCLDEFDQGSCLVYDNHKFSIFLCSICFVAKMVSLLLYIGSKVIIDKSKVEKCEVEMFDNANYEHE